MAVVLGLLSVSLVGLVTPAADPVSREITLVARDMAFYLSEQTQAGPNPTLQLKVGEQVRIVLRNQDPWYRAHLRDQAVERVDDVTPR